MATKYLEKLKDPRWQKRRLEILSRDEWKCRSCGNGESTLHVHHLWYEGDPWDAPATALLTLCEECHEMETSMRGEAEKELLATLRDNQFLVEHVCELVVALKNYGIIRDEFDLYAISWVMSRKDVLDELWDRARSTYVSQE